MKAVGPWAPEGPLADWSERRLEWVIFGTCLAVRVAFVLATFETALAPDNDWQRYDRQSDAILRGEFDLEEELFITAPLYPYLQALFKLVFGGAWLPALTSAVVTLSALSGVAIYRLGRWSFHRPAGVLAAMVYAVFPTTLIWVNSRSQDMPFMVFTVFFVYALVRAVHDEAVWRTGLAALLFSLAMHTKSHLLLFAPFVPIYWWISASTSVRSRLRHVTLFACVAVATTLPWGLYNLHRHDVYVIGGTGLGGYFLTGHNDDVYRFIVDPPPLGSPEHRRIHAMDYHVLAELRDSLDALPHRQRQQLLLSRGVQWSVEDPGRLAKLTLYNVYYFFLPGVNPNHYPFLQWLLLFVVSLPLHVLAYIGLATALREDFRKHAWMLGMVFVLLMMSVIFYPQNRFRSITIEPFFIVFAAHAVLGLWPARGSPSRVVGRPPA